MQVPSFANPSRYRLWRENAAFAKDIAAGSLVLDAGAGTAPYRALFGHTRYETADFHKVDKQYSPSTYVCDLSSLPVEDARFDYILLNQVLEHLPEPLETLAELHRVLKPGGRMIYTAPLFYEEHETPYDFYRYTSFGVRYLMEHAGFTIDRLDWLEGYFATVSYQLGTMARALPSHPSKIIPGFRGYVAVLPVLFVRGFSSAASVYFRWLDTRHKFTDRGYPKNYIALLTKPQ